MSPNSDSEIILPKAVEAMLREWPVVEREESDWEATALAIEARLSKLEPTPEALLAPPFPELPSERSDSVGHVAVAKSSAETPSSVSSKTESSSSEQSLVALARASVEKRRKRQEQQHLDASAVRGTRDKRSRMDALEVERLSRPSSAPIPPPPSTAGRVTPSEVGRSNPTRAHETSEQTARGPRSERRRAAFLGWGIGALGIAAAVAMYFRTQSVVSGPEPLPPNLKPTNAQAEAELAKKTEPGTQQAEPAQAESPAPSEPAQTMAPRAVAKATAKTEAKANPRPQPARAKAPPKPSQTAEAVKLEEESAPIPQLGPGPSEPGMRIAEGDPARQERPSIGAVQAATGSVMATARACVAGHQEPSRAVMVFGSDGRVKSVKVTGPAQGTPAEACIRTALSGARVQPFAQPTFSVSLTVRPY